ncbi:MAG: hypothetical protein JXQ27_15375 [Acidobacteria bacterium]|nr:hypothetical protein [Acidobacteriota bacterium]
MISSEFWRRLPKTETHVHLEGSISVERLHRLHRRHGLEWASWTPAEIRRQLSFATFPRFLEAFKKVCLAVRHEDDFVPVTEDFFDMLDREHIVHCEFFYTPAISWKFGLSAETVLENILAIARREGRRRSISWGIILDNVRQFPVDAFRRTLALGLRYRDAGVVGIGIGGDETCCSLEEYANPLAEARAGGLSVYLHTGETGDAAAMLADLKTARPRRVGHGLAAARSPAIRDYLQERGVVLDICPTSNIRTGVVENIEAHPLRDIASQNLPYTINSDDPALFETSLSAEYALVAERILNPLSLVNMVKTQEKNPLLPAHVKESLAAAGVRIIKEFGHGE